MALGDKAFGFRSVNSDETEKPRKCLLPSTDSTIYGKGDAVILAGSSGRLSTPDKAVPTVSRASAGAGNALYGYIVGFEHHSVASGMSLNRTHRPASTGMYCFVVPFKQGNEYYIRSNATLTADNVDGVANLATISNADTLNGQSKMELDASSIQESGNNTYQLRVVGVGDDGTNDITDTTPVVKVMINNLQTANATAGV